MSRERAKESHKKAFRDSLIRRVALIFCTGADCGKRAQVRTVDEAEGGVSQLGYARAQYGVGRLPGREALDCMDGNAWVAHTPREQNMSCVVARLARLSGAGREATRSGVVKVGKGDQSERLQARSQTKFMRFCPGAPSATPTRARCTKGTALRRPRQHPSYRHAPSLRRASPRDL